MPPKKKVEVLTTVATGPDGQVRWPGQTPAPEWSSAEVSWFLDDLRAAGALVDGEEDLDLAKRTAGSAWAAQVPLTATGPRSRAGGTG